MFGLLVVVVVVVACTALLAIVRIRLIRKAAQQADNFRTCQIPTRRRN